MIGGYPLSAWGSIRAATSAPSNGVAPGCSSPCDRERAPDVGNLQLAADSSRERRAGDNVSADGLREVVSERAEGIRTGVPIRADVTARAEDSMTTLSVGLELCWEVAELLRELHVSGAHPQRGSHVSPMVADAGDESRLRASRPSSRVRSGPPGASRWRVFAARPPPPSPRDSRPHSFGRTATVARHTRQQDAGPSPGRERRWLRRGEGAEWDSRSAPR